MGETDENQFLPFLFIFFQKLKSFSKHQSSLLTKGQERGRNTSFFDNKKLFSKKFEKLKSFSKRQSSLFTKGKRNYGKNKKSNKNGV